MKEIIIKKNDSGQRIDKFLLKSFKNLPSTLIYKYIRKKRVKINNKRCKVSTILNLNDILTLYINDEFLEKSNDVYDFLKSPSDLDIIYEDKNIMLLNKKPGLLVHQDATYHFDSLISRIHKYLYKKNEFDPKKENSFIPALVNRIDRNTSGIVIAAKNAESLRVLNQKMKNREISKFYLCLVHGKMKKSEEILVGYLYKNEKQNRVYIKNKQENNTKLIKTKYRVLKSSEKYSLLEIELLTGRTHQIRAHLASISHSIVGDGKYGKNILNKGTNLKYQALCSYKLVFNFDNNENILNYINHKKFKISDIWFLNKHRLI